MSNRQGEHLSDQLLAILCHDISNPLSVLAFNLEILAKTEFEGSQDINQQRFFRCQTAVKKIRSILVMVRDAHALQLGKINITVEPVSLRKCWDQAVSDYETSLLVKKINIQETEWPSTDWVMGHEQILISHVFSNLLSNAIKFSSASKTLWVGVQNSIDNENEVSFYISDEGPGIPQSKIEFLFDFKKQTTSTGSDHERGTGLGLPILRFFLNQLLAKIEVHSRVKVEDDFFHGTLFEIRFKKAQLNNKNV